MPHDFKKFPELRNSEMNIYYIDSPHKQIVRDFRATIEKVSDGDTIRVSCNFRDFTFPIRINNIDAPELNARGGHEARDHLASIIEGEEVDIILSNERVEKWGRLLADILFKGMLISEEMMRSGFATRFDERRPTELPNLNKELVIERWL